MQQDAQGRRQQQRDFVNLPRTRPHGFHADYRPPIAPKRAGRWLAASAGVVRSYGGSETGP